MKLIRAIKAVSWGYLWLAIILSGAGLLLLVYPGQSMKTIAYTIGAAAILLGLLQVVRVLSDPRRGLRFAVGIICAALTVICGILMFILAEQTMKLFPAFIGLFIVIDSSFKLETVVRSHRYRMKAFWILLVFACLTIAGGFLCIRSESFSIGTLAAILGVSLLLDGIQNFFSLFYIDALRSRDAKPAEKPADKPTEETTV